MRIFSVVAASGALIALACSSGAPASPGGGGAADVPGSGVSGPVTFHKHVEPVLQKVCQNCHVAGGIAPFALVTFDDARAVASAIVAQTAARSMPPWGAQDTSECKPPMPWKDDLRLTDQEIALLASWHAGGDLEGDPKDAPPPRTVPPVVHLPGALSLAPATPFALAGSTDTFKCFVLDPKITATTYLTGTNFVPTNKTIVHHALAFAIPAGAKVPGEVYDCFGGPGVDGANLVAAWAPGGVPGEYPADVGMLLDAGSRFVMQVHYHPHANGTKDPDATSFEYRLTDTAPVYRAVPTLIGNFATAVGVAKADSTHEVALLEHHVREVLNRTSMRRFGVLNPVKVVITNFPDDLVETMEVVNNPENPDAGERPVEFSRSSGNVSRTASAMNPSVP